MLVIHAKGPFITAVPSWQKLLFQLAVGSSDSAVKLFDMRMLSLGAAERKSYLRWIKCQENKDESILNPNFISRGLISKFVAPGLEKKHRRITAVDFRSVNNSV